MPDKPSVRAQPDDILRGNPHCDKARPTAAGRAAQPAPFADGSFDTSRSDTVSPSS
ncbi:hypothetical protein GCM10023144_43630 [Pigmentiphaga soli]|uniref:Uncharacterized protein n=1 Tax=Pigmentiphaga soli TaxID=1007095 RepID=A0ABP8HNZ9_9BURK